MFLQAQGAPALHLGERVIEQCLKLLYSLKRMDFMFLKGQGVLSTSTRPFPGLGGQVLQKLILRETPRNANRCQGSNSCPISDLELRHLQVTLKWWSKSYISSVQFSSVTQSCRVRKQTWENVDYACWSTEYMTLVFQFFCYVSSILCFCFLLSFGNSSSSFSLDESKTLNF